MALLFDDFSQTLPLILVEIEVLQKELKSVSETLIEVKANKKSIEAKIAKKIDLCVMLNNQNANK
jgi:hypothetical protein